MAFCIDLLLNIFHTPCGQTLYLWMGLCWEMCLIMYAIIYKSRLFEQGGKCTGSSEATPYLWCWWCRKVTASSTSLLKTWDFSSVKSPLWVISLHHGQKAVIEMPHFTSVEDKNKEWEGLLVIPAERWPDNISLWLRRILICQWRRL